MSATFPYSSCPNEDRSLAMGQSSVRGLLAMGQSSVRGLLTNIDPERGNAGGLGKHWSLVPCKIIPWKPAFLGNAVYRIRCLP
jgi:hypothetical protein